MTRDSEMTDRGRGLREKYGLPPEGQAMALTDADLQGRLETLDAVDQHFTAATTRFIAGMHARRVLDPRTRVLVLIGQFAMTRSAGHLDTTLRSALSAGVDPREVLEVILMCQIYGGDTVVQPAVSAAVGAAAELGLQGSLEAQQLPIDGRDRERSLDEERTGWSAADRHHPDLAGFIERHGWLGISTGLLHRPGHHLAILGHLEELDAEYAGLWERFAYQDLYSRSLLDDRTRLLCTVGDLLAIGAIASATQHMTGALAAGATAREVLEVILQSGPYFGFPLMTSSLRVFEGLLKDAGRLDEIGGPAAHPYDAQAKGPAA